VGQAYGAHVHPDPVREFVPTAIESTHVLADTVQPNVSFKSTTRFSQVQMCYDSMIESTTCCRLSRKHVSKVATSQN
jgi:hypothetical protein